MYASEKGHAEVVQELIKRGRRTEFPTRTILLPISVSMKKQI